MNIDLMFSSKTDLWETPQTFFDLLDQEFCFGVDVCALSYNTKCAVYFTPDQNGLKQDWSGYGAVWCNPPYGREISKWVRKAYMESLKGVLICMLLPARTDTKWFHDYIYGIASIRFIRGRLKFGSCATPAPFPSMVVIYNEEMNK